MPIEGPIRELALSDLLQLLFLSRRSGRLTVSTDEAGTTSLLVRDGSLVGATGVPELRLGRLLVRSGRATDEQVRRALAEQSGADPPPLGEILARSGVVRGGEVERQLRFQIEETVFDLMRLEDGQLRFEEAAAGAARRMIEVELGTDAVLMDAARRIDEYAEVVGRISAGDPLPRLASHADPAAPILKLQTLEWEVLGEIDGERTLREISRSLGRGELEVARALYGLLSAGVVEVGTRGGRRSDGDRQRALIHSIDRALREGRRAEAEALLVSLAPDDGDEETDAGTLLLQGRLLALNGDWPAALRTLEAALEFDPLLAQGYFHVARAAVRVGELERARQALERYSRLSDDSDSRRLAAAALDGVLAQMLNAMTEAES
ncbi:MAG: DUF4388 domain-containing protein [Gemmatimonadota bacterium]